ncbi:NADH-quinone oxidoreductase subunit N [Parapedobacter defluvii]|uniref:NADH-quinone oxidoreductase subunit N n=1 Tax=Parapedobacter defluvii TaxID=2045106 RepID=A0ABQ1LVY8_9SPHI|nr:NADH-quinone oxidoreductase subunit N [Parapedobacter defluvii]RQP16406.1 MAG: NADH-quinone oxidoreductase subunit N [Parapedobacter sp.]GGC30554.1 NADH-quinone oxidoreductase subunit N [Parapedobacter defluvii]
MSAIITLSLLAILVLYLGLFKARNALLPVSLLGLVSTLVLFVIQWEGQAVPLYSGMVLFDHYAIAFSVLCVLLTILVLLLSKNYFDAGSTHIAEYYALILFSLTGALLVTSFHNLAMLFIGIEIMSVALYILAGIRKKDFASNEAALKYFLMGAFSTGFLLFGVALLYGASGSFDLAEIKDYVVSNPQAVSPLFYGGILLLLVGLAFKVGAAPFHFWAPDVYDGAPILITTFMITVVKTAAFAGFLRLFYFCFVPLQDFWMPALLVMTVVTLFIGNITALVQSSFKRMLAYSSISHAGYMLFAIVAVGPSSSEAVLIYAAAYSLASVVAFGTLILVKRATGSDHFEAFNGLAKKNPYLSLALTVAMLSLAGIPLTAGFIGKFMMFSGVLADYQILLVVLAVLNAAIGIFYYFRVIVAMYFRPLDRDQLVVNGYYKTVLVVAILATLLLGIYPAWITGLV